jgi:hypothetical protein
MLLVGSGAPVSGLAPVRILSFGCGPASLNCLLGLNGRGGVVRDIQGLLDVTDGPGFGTALRPWVGGRMASCSLSLIHERLGLRENHV